MSGFKIIKPPSDLKAKAPKVSDADLESAFARAEKVLEALGGEF